VSTANDSLSEVFGLVVGRAKKPAGRCITDQGEAYLNKLGVNLIGHVGGVFDPLLERYIGQKVVVEIQEGDEVHEHVGIFKNYSPDFIEILDVQYPEPRLVDLNGCNAEREDCARIKVEGTKMTVHNPTAQPILLHSFQGPQASAEAHALVPLHQPAANGAGPRVRVTDGKTEMSKA